jgi:hypothetical protein
MRVLQWLLFVTCLFTGKATCSEVCAECHAAIYRSYSSTPMAQTSGPADKTVPGEFTDPITKTSFRIDPAAGVHLSQGDLEANRKLDYFIGAGAIGRSYISSLDTFLFQSPISFYSSTRSWDLSPGFEGSHDLNMTRPVEPACLNCHASNLRSLPGTVNGYGSPAFSPGVTCERCHGAGSQHITRMRSRGARPDTHEASGIVNPAKLNREQRESVCAQCHLVGVVRIAKLSKTVYSPGENLFDGTSAFLWSEGSQPLAANSHFEQLVRSVCWKASKGNLWCGTCHDPHLTVPPAERVAYFRQRCLACHQKTGLDCTAPAVQREAAHDDCISCHMPSKPIDTVQHAAQTDHTITRKPHPEVAAALSDNATLIPFPGSGAGNRELGLAYASEAIAHNRKPWAMRALNLLQAAPADDVASLDQLAQIYDHMGREKEACELFSKVAQSGDAAPGAWVNQGTCQASSGDLPAAIKSWSEALARNPGLTSARLNLAVAQYRTGNTGAARATLKVALRYDPFSRQALELLQSLPGN